MNVTGTLVFQNPLAANSSVFDAFSNPTNPLISFEFKDGLHVLTDANTTLGVQSRINVGTDNNGTIKDWYIDLYIGDLGAALLVMDTVEIISSGGNLCGGGCNVDEFGVIYHNALGYPAPNNNSIEVNIGRANGAGIWTLQPVPLPGTLGLLGIGLVGLSNLRRKFMTTNLGTGGIQSESC